MATLTGIVKTDLLDPRPRADAEARPILGAANIPVNELPARVHELPAPGERTRVAVLAGDGADEAAADQAVAFLQEHGRRPVLDRDVDCAAGPSARPALRLWSPSPWVENCAQSLPPGRVLDLGCGTGRDAVYLAALGWCVTGVDLLPDALERARALERAYSDHGSLITWLQRDVVCDPPDWGADFDLILMIRFFRRALLAQCAPWLTRPDGHHAGGSLLVECFTREQRKASGRTLRATHTVEPGELPTLMGRLTIVKADECTAAGARLARVWAQRGDANR